MSRSMVKLNKITKDFRNKHKKLFDYLSRKSRAFIYPLICEFAGFFGIGIGEETHISGKIIATLRTVKGREKGKIEVIVSENIIVTSGKTAIARRLVGIGLKTSEGKSTYIAVGTNNTTPVIGNTTLGTELARKIKSTSSYISNVGNFRAYFTTAEANGSIEEAAVFGEEATGTVDSGTMINHALITITKDNTKTLTLEIVFTIS